MMNSKVKKLALAMSLALGGVSMVPSAQAVSVSADNLGQALIFPYYTVRGGWLSLFGVVNTSNQVVAVKVRFHEAYNSRDVFDFNIILSPYDEWTGWVADNGAGPVVHTEDNSCTVGDIFSAGAAGVPFPAPISYTAAGNATDGGPTTVDRMREGYVEMIMMGASPGTPAAVYPLASGAIHVAGARPAGCAALVSAFQNSSVLGTPGACPTGTVAVPNVSGTLRGEFCNYSSVTSGTVTTVLNPLKGSFSLVNGGEGFNAVGLPTALQNFRNSTAMTLQLAPTSLAAGTVTTAGNATIAFVDSWHEPSMNSVNASVGMQLVPSAAAANTPLSGAALAVNAVSDALMHTNIINEWSNRTNAAAGWVTATDWVITFPTKGFYVDYDANNQYAGRNQGRGNAALGLQTVVTTPFATPFVNSGVSPTGKYGQSCDPMSFTLRNREEQSSQGAGFSPGGTAQLCYETNVLTFNSGLILNSPIAASINYPEAYTFGWLNVAMGGTVGLPAVGFSITSRDDSAGLLSEAGLVNHSYVPPALLNATYPTPAFTPTPP